MHWEYVQWEVAKEACSTVRNARLDRTSIRAAQEAATKAKVNRQIDAVSD